MRPTNKAVYSSRSADKFVVRFPDGMREQIAAIASKHHRSMNSEIIAKLEVAILDELKEANPAMHVTAGDEVPMPVVDAWVPVFGMLVCERLDKEKVYGLLNFEQTDDGVLMAELSGANGVKKCLPLGHLQPFTVT